MISMKRLENKIIELSLTDSVKIKNPFWDIEVKAVFYHADYDITQTVYGFYDGTDEQGRQVWKIRWMPSAMGLWSCRYESSPGVSELCGKTELTIRPEDLRAEGKLCVDPAKEWKFFFENGEPFFLLGDTMYNLFGAHYCQVDIKPVLERRRQQGVNYIRVRMQNSSFHQPILSSFMKRDCWPWGGSAQWPDFKSFNREYFIAVDEVMELVTRMGIGLEIIFEAWMLEFPFNDRARFIPEYEEHWFQYIIARYSAFPCVYLWCPANEYEFYPDGTAKYQSEADRWVKRMTSLIRKYDPFSHPIGIHNWGEETSPLTERMRDISDLEVYLVQTAWVKELYKPDADLELCANLEEQVRQLVPVTDRAVIVSEFGYEMTEGQNTVDAHELLNHHHTRRGQWRAGFAGYPVVHGFNNTWGPHFNITKDARGADMLIYFYRFMTEAIPFYEMHPKQDLLSDAGGGPEETMPRCLANHDCSVVAVYYPVKGECRIALPNPLSTYSYCWYNPRNGVKTEFAVCSERHFATPAAEAREDWVLLIKQYQDDTGRKTNECIWML